MSPRPNRVTPTGEVAAIALRGAWMGNRGILHADAGHIVRHHVGSLWIICELSFRGWRARQWEPHHYTPLFFHDEAVALAAGHRPCALCRREAYQGFRTAVAETEGSTAVLTAKALDGRLHSERLVPRTSRQNPHRLAWGDLPDGAFVMLDQAPNLLWRNRIIPWTVEGYAAARPAPHGGEVDVLTPPTTLAALRGGYRPQVDPAATC